MFPIKNKVIGKILKPHGLKGDLKILPFSKNFKKFIQISFFYIKVDDAFQKLEVSTFKHLNQHLVFHFKGYDTLQSIEKLRNSYLYLEREKILGLSTTDLQVAEQTNCTHGQDQEEYLVDDLIECSFFLLSNQSQSIGIISAYYLGGNNGVYEISSLDSERKAYIPCEKEFFHLIDLIEKKVIFDDSKMDFFFQ